MKANDFHLLCCALLRTRAELRDATIAGLRSPELGKFLRRRVLAKRSALCAMLHPEIKRRVEAWEQRRRGTRGK